MWKYKYQKNNILYIYFIHLYPTSFQNFPKLKSFSYTKNSLYFPINSLKIVPKCLCKHSTLVGRCGRTRTVVKAWMSLKFSKIEHGAMELAVLEHLKKSPYSYDRSNVVSTLVLSYFDGSSSFLQVSRTTIKASMSLIFSHSWPPTIELAAIECLKYSSIMSWPF